MEIGDKVIISEPRHPLFKLTGSIVGFRGEKSPGDVWLLILVDARKRSFLIPQSMVTVTKSHTRTTWDYH